MVAEVAAVAAPAAKPKPDPTSAAFAHVCIRRFHNARSPSLLPAEFAMIETIREEAKPAG